MRISMKPLKNAKPKTVFSLFARLPVPPALHCQMAATCSAIRQKQESCAFFWEGSGPAPPKRNRAAAGVHTRRFECKQMSSAVISETLQLSR